MGDERVGDAVSSERGHDGWDISVRAGVVVAQEPYGEGNAEVIMEEACKKGVRLVVAERLLAGPGGVELGEPEEVVVA